MHFHSSLYLKMRSFAQNFGRFFRVIVFVRIKGIPEALTNYVAFVIC